MGGLVDVPATVCVVPAGQLPCAVHVVWFGLLVYVPAAQAEQVWSATVLPIVEMYEPAAHEVHAVQLVASVAVLKVPLAHAAHVRLAVALPAAET